MYNTFTMPTYLARVSDKSDIEHDVAVTWQANPNHGSNEPPITILSVQNRCGGEVPLSADEMEALIENILDDEMGDTYDEDGFRE